MMENQSNSKKQNLDYQPHHDMLSDLPVSIIHIILAHVPIREAVRTSVLSKQWRYTWTSLPELVFDERCASQEDKSLSKYEDFIFRVLSRLEGPIHKFKLLCPFRPSKPYIAKWELWLCSQDIKEFILQLPYTYHHWPELQSSVYFCKKVTSLKLYRCKLSPPTSTFTRFLFLKCLSLVYVDISPKDVESLVASCPRLERFELLYNGRFGLRILDLRIRAPYLKYLSLGGGFRELCLNAPLLAEMSVEFVCYISAVDQEHEIPACNYTYFFGTCSNIEMLHGNGFFTEYLSRGIESCHHSLVFHHLKLIELQDVDARCIKDILVVARLVIGAPNLHQLKISLIGQEESDDESEGLDVCFRDLLKCSPNFVLEKLRIVKVICVIGRFVEMEFIKFLLKSSPRLETMKVAYDNTLYL